MVLALARSVAAAAVPTLYRRTRRRRAPRLVPSPTPGAPAAPRHASSSGKLVAAASFTGQAVHTH